MLHEVYHITIKSSGFAKLLQAFEESADWVLFIGVNSWGKGANTYPKFIACLVILCFNRLCISVSNQILFLD